MKCSQCGIEVKTNGIGPSNSPKFSWLLKTIYHYSCKRFHEAGRIHDHQYHVYGNRKEWADENFLKNMLKAANGNWWFEYQANKFYLAVKHGGQSSYDEAQLECLKQMNLNSRDVN